jgi:hypothetical protein
MKVSAHFEVLIANWKDYFKIDILEDSERERRVNWIQLVSKRATGKLVWKR